MTHKTPITLISDSPSSWIKLFVILQAKAPTESVLDLRFRPARDVYPKPDILDKLLEIARATKGEGPDSGEEGFAILKRPFLDTDDLTDLLIELRTRPFYFVLVRLFVCCFALYFRHGLILL